MFARLTTRNDIRLKFFETDFMGNSVFSNGNGDMLYRTVRRHHIRGVVRHWHLSTTFLGFSYTNLSRKRECVQCEELTGLRFELLPDCRRWGWDVTWPDHARLMLT